MFAQKFADSPGIIQSNALCSKDRLASKEWARGEVSVSKKLEETNWEHESFSITMFTGPRVPLQKEAHVLRARSPTARATGHHSPAVTGTVPHPWLPGCCRNPILVMKTPSRRSPGAPRHLETGGRRTDLLTEKPEGAICPERREANHPRLLPAWAKGGLQGCVV